MLPKAPALQSMKELNGVGHEARRLIDWVTGEILLAKLTSLGSNSVDAGQLQKRHHARLCHDLASAGCSCRTYAPQSNCFR